MTAIIPAPVRLDVTDQLRRTLRRDTSLSVPSAGLVATEQWAAIEPILARHTRDLTTRAALAEARLYEARRALHDLQHHQVPAQTGPAR